MALGRNIKMFLCQRYTGEKLKDIGIYFGIGESGVSQAYRRVKDKMKNEDLTPMFFFVTKKEHVWELGKLPQLHRDPFDRLLIAQSRYEKMGLISADDIVAKYETRIFW